MSKQYLEKEYALVYSELQTARSEDERFSLLNYMACLQRTAMEVYGFEYADDLHNRIVS